MKIFVYVELTIFEYVTFVATNRCFSSSVAVKSGLLGADRAGIDQFPIKTLPLSGCVILHKVVV